MLKACTRPLLSAAVFWIGTALGDPAKAQAFDAVRLIGAEPTSARGLFGLGAVRLPQYMGSDETRTIAAPIAEYQWGNGWFAGTSNGIGYNFSRSARIDYGLRLTADLGRAERRSPRLQGMGDIDAAAEFGGFLNYKLLPSITLTSSIRFGSGNDGRGAVLDLGAFYTAQRGRWSFGFGPAFTVVNEDYMQEFFGVTAEQSARTGYAIFTPKGGVRDARFIASATYSLTSSLSLTGAVTGSRLFGDAADSPLTFKRNAITSLIGLSYAL